MTAANVATGLWWIALTGLLIWAFVEIYRAGAPLPDPRDVPAAGPDPDPRNHAEALRAVRAALVDLGYPPTTGRYVDGQLVISNHEVPIEDAWRAFTAAGLTSMCCAHWSAAAKQARRGGPAVWQAARRRCQATTGTEQNCQTMAPVQGTRTEVTATA